MHYKSNTGGVKEFGDPGELNDTESSRNFKKAYLMHHYLNDPYDEDTKERLKDYIPFYKLSLTLDKNKKPQKFALEIVHERSKESFLKLKLIDNKISLEFPKGKYKIIITTKMFLFFKKRKTLSLDLTKNAKQDINF